MYEKKSHHLDDARYKFVYLDGRCFADVSLCRNHVPACTHTSHGRRTLYSCVAGSGHKLHCDGKRKRAVNSTVCKCDLFYGHYSAYVELMKRAISKNNGSQGGGKLVVLVSTILILLIQCIDLLSV